MCSRQHSDVDFSWFGFPNPGNLFFLKNAQKTRLDVRGNIADLIKKKRPSMSRLKEALLMVDGACKRPFSVSEQLTGQ